MSCRPDELAPTRPQAPSRSRLLLLLLAALSQACAGNRVVADDRSARSSGDAAREPGRREDRAAGGQPAPTGEDAIVDEVWEQGRGVERCVPFPSREEFRARVREYAAVTRQAAAVVAAFMAMAPDQVTRSRSPSGRREVCIEESCLGFACTHEAFLIEGGRVSRLGCPDVGDAEGAVFVPGSLHWNEAEDRVDWRVSTRHGERSGTLDLAAPR